MDPDAILAAIEQQRDSDAEPREEAGTGSVSGVLSRDGSVRSAAASVARGRARRSSAARARRACGRCGARQSARRDSVRARRARDSRLARAHVDGIAVPRGVARISAIRSASSSTRSQTSIRWLAGEIEPPPADLAGRACRVFHRHGACVAAGLMGLLDLARVTKV